MVCLTHTRLLTRQPESCSTIPTSLSKDTSAFMVVIYFGIFGVYIGQEERNYLIVVLQKTKRFEFCTTAYSI
ncbi:hypothetical protein CI102_12232 [Trichoderma harzianum]|nr:hypothetical protein CI102_12232 [Trichoderma harzianum]